MREKWTSEDIPDLTSKVIIVTGANSGIGFETAKELSRKGAKTILACCDIEGNKYTSKGALAKIKEEIPDASVEIIHLDLASLNSIHEFADEFKNKYERLDVLVNNAGIWACPHLKTEDGFEKQLGVNFLGHFALTGLLMDHLKKTPKSRVVNVSSLAHKPCKIDFQNLMFEKGGYKPHETYRRSKLAKLLFTYELQRRFQSVGVNCISVAAHPGTTKTNLSRYRTKEVFWKIFFPILNAMLAQNTPIGALPTLRASVDLEVKGGDYYGPRGVFETRGHPVKVKSTKESHNKENAKELWEISEKLTKIRYSFERM
ncbi:MAG: SDR family NAD(P)-dependent oxidoreductase [bacterium]|nr:SDR family NAD(P)-dependent oxidoreductase [bacterium]